MRADIDKDGYLRIDAQSLVEALPDTVKRDIAKWSIFDELLIKGILEGLVNDRMWSDDDEQGPWWFSSETFTKLRLQLLPLLPVITAEAVCHLVDAAAKQRREQLRWHDAAWKLWHAWPDRETRPEHPSSAYERGEAMTREQAESHLRAVEAKVEEERTEIEKLRAKCERMRGVLAMVRDDLDRAVAEHDSSDPRHRSHGGQHHNGPCCEFGSLTPRATRHMRRLRDAIDVATKGPTTP